MKLKIYRTISKRIQDKILQVNDIELSYYFARDIECVDNRAHYQIVKNSDLRRDFLIYLEDKKYQIFFFLN